MLYTSRLNLNVFELTAVFASGRPEHTVDQTIVLAGFYWHQDSILSTPCIVSGSKALELAKGRSSCQQPHPASAHFPSCIDVGGYQLVFQMDQSASGHQRVTQHIRERSQNQNSDRGLSLHVLTPYSQNGLPYRHASMKCDRS